MDTKQPKSKKQKSQNRNSSDEMFCSVLAEKEVEREWSNFRKLLDLLTHGGGSESSSAVFYVLQIWNSRCPSSVQELRDEGDSAGLVLADPRLKPSQSSEFLF